MTHKPRPAFMVSSRVRRSAIAFLAALGAAGCATAQHSDQSLVPNKFQARTGPFAVFANSPIAADAQVVRDLQALEQDVESSLGVRVDESAPPVEVYILTDRDAFNHFLTFYYPELPPRRAFFLGQGPSGVIYTYYNDRLSEDLRHEATHALLNVVVGDLPLWLDEGLAEDFEGATGRNADHLDRLPDDQRTGWKPDLVRLETLKSVPEMTPRDYRESWAWVHFLLNGPPAGKKALLSYLTRPRPAPDSTPFSEYLARCEGANDRFMLAHLEQVRATPLESQTARVDPGIHLQNAPIDPVPRPSPRRGFFDRIFAVLGFR